MTKQSKTDAQAKQLKVTQRRSVIDRPKDQKDTVRRLKLKHGFLEEGADEPLAVPEQLGLWP